MNWTERAFHHHATSKTNAEVVKQKRYFAKARAEALRPAKSTPTPLNFIPLGDGARGQSPPVALQVSNDRPSTGRSYSAHSTRSRVSRTRIGKGRHKRSPIVVKHGKQSVVDDGRAKIHASNHRKRRLSTADKETERKHQLQQKCRRLLRQDDWVGTSFQKPLSIQFRSQGVASKDSKWGFGGPTRAGTSPNRVDQRAARPQLRLEKGSSPQDQSIQIRIGSQRIRLKGSDEGHWSQATSRPLRTLYASSQKTTSKSKSSPFFRQTNHPSSPPSIKSSLKDLSRHRGPSSSKTSGSQGESQVRRRERRVTGTSESGARHHQSVARPLHHIKSFPAVVHQPVPQRKSLIHHHLQTSQSPITSLTIYSPNYRERGGLDMTGSSADDNQDTWSTTVIAPTSQPIHEGAVPSPQSGFVNLSTHQKARRRAVSPPVIQKISDNDGQKSTYFVSKYFQYGGSTASPPQRALIAQPCVQHLNNQTEKAAMTGSTLTSRPEHAAHMTYRSQHTGTVSRPIIIDSDDMPPGEINKASPKLTESIARQQTLSALAHGLEARLIPEAKTVAQDNNGVPQQKDLVDSYRDTDLFTRQTHPSCGLDNHEDILRPDQAAHEVSKEHNPEDEDEDEEAAWMKFINGNSNSDIIQATFEEVALEAAQVAWPSSNLACAGDSANSRDFDTAATFGSPSTDADPGSSSVDAIRPHFPAQEPSGGLDISPDNTARGPTQLPSIFAGSSPLVPDIQSPSLSTHGGSLINLSNSKAHQDDASMVCQPSLLDPGDEMSMPNFRFHQPGRFVGRLAKSPRRTATSLVQLSLHSGPKKRGRPKKKARDGRADIRGLPDYHGDPIDS